MSDEKKEQQDFLSGHEALLNSIKKPDESETQEEDPAAEPVPGAAPAAEEPEVPAENEPAAAPEPEPAPAEEEVVDQKVVAEVPPVVTETKAQPAPKKKKPANHAEAVKQRHEAVEQAEVKEVLNFVMKYVKPIAAVIIVVCMLVMAISIIQSSRLKKDAAADTALMQAQTAADYQAIIDDYSKTPSAPLAMLGLASEKFNAGAVSEAADVYAQFVKNYPNHENAEQAAYNQINCIEAQGQYAEAAAAYGSFRAENKDSRFAPQALLDQGRCFEKLNKYAEAKQAYDDVIGMYPNTAWAQLAQNNITILNSRM